MVVIPEAKSIDEFQSVLPTTPNNDFVIPPSHRFQKIIEAGDMLSSGGVLPIRNDFAGYVPISESSTKGYLSINSEAVPGGVTVLDIKFDNQSNLWEVESSTALDFSNVGGTARNCSGTVTPWNTVLSCEEAIDTNDENEDGYYDTGWTVEIDPASKQVLNKRWALGNFQHENAAIHNNERTLYQGADSKPGYLYKFVADVPEDLSSGKLYVYKGEKRGDGDWIQIPNTTIEERNATLIYSRDVEATVFDGIEDVEIGPDGRVYFAVKGEDTVYRFTDSDPILGNKLSMEPFVGNLDYTIIHNGGSTTVAWGTGNDNLAFDENGNLWVLQDGDNNYIWVVGPDHNQASPDVRIFGTAPLGAECTGITFTPDFKFMFISIQSPDAANGSTNQIDAAGQAIAFDNHITLVISRLENLGN
jgi:secreted PhoX family phosphatase